VPYTAVLLALHAASVVLLFELVRRRAGDLIGMASAALLLVLGANDDRISTPADLKATASLYGVPALVLPGLAHMLMLERDWETAARPLLAWLEGSG
jgi:alpha-beta hydrolase superfamily lysophospholipase